MRWVGRFAHAGGIQPHKRSRTAMPENTALVEQRQKFAAKQKEMGEVFELAKDGSVYDLSRKSVLEKLGAVDSTDAAAKIKQRNVELANLGGELQQAELKEINAQRLARDEERNTPYEGMEHRKGDAAEAKSFGQRFIESKAWTEGWQKQKQQTVTGEVEIDMKTLFQTSAGYLPQSVRSGLAVDAVTRPIQLIDLIPSRPINQPLDKYMLETTRTHSAAEKAEGTTYAESTFVWAEQSNPVQKITDSIPVTDEQLDDAPEVAAILDQRIRFGLRQRLDQQIWNGNGTPPNLRGILNVSGIGTQAKSTDPVFDAVFKAMMVVIVTGRAQPNFLAFHPTDWQN